MESIRFKLRVLGIYLSVFCNAFVFTLVFPFASKFVMDTGKSDSRSATGYWVGILTFSLMLGRALASPIFGVICDKWGRKPVMLVGLFSTIVFSGLFGVSQNYWWGVSIRFLTGFFTPLSLVCKTLLSETMPADKQASAMAWFAMSWQTGNISGNVVGGILVDPVSSGIVTGGILAEFPYLLPNLVASGVAVVTTVLVVFTLDETLKTDQQKTSQDSRTIWDIAKEPVVLKILVVYFLLCVNSTAYHELISLWCWARKEHGGFEFRTEDIGITLGISSTFLLLFQKRIHSYFVGKYGVLKFEQYTIGISVPVLLAIPLGTFLRYSATFSWVAVIACSICWWLNNFFCMSAMIVLSNNCVVAKERGRLNGIFLTVGSFARSISPVVFGNVFALTTESGYSYPINFAFSFNLMALIAFIGSRIVQKLPPQLDYPKEKLIDNDEIHKHLLQNNSNFKDA